MDESWGAFVPEFVQAVARRGTVAPREAGSAQQQTAQDEPLLYCSVRSALWLASCLGVCVRVRVRTPSTETPWMTPHSRRGSATTRAICA